MTAPALNRLIPDVRAEATGGKAVRLRDLFGSNVVLYFYPRDATPGCTTEGQDFRDLYARFRRQNTVVLGVSRDGIASHEKFKARHQFPFDLLSDPDETLCRAFDVIKEKSMYGRKHLGVERSTFLIGSDGKLKREWRKVKVKGHAAEVLAAVRELSQ